MKTTFNLTRLGIGLQEFYYLYWKDFRTMALLVLIFAIVGNLYPTSIFYEFILRDSKENLSIDTAYKLISGKSVTMRQLMFIPMLLTVPVLYQFIKRIRTTISRNLLPLSSWENTLIPILATLGILLTLSLEIYLLDTIITQIYHWLFYDDAMRLIAQDGQLYPYIDPYAYFNHIPLSLYLFSFNKLIVIIIVIMIGLLSIWEMRFLKLAGLCVFVAGIYLANFWISFRTYNRAMITFENSIGIPQFIYNVCLLIISLYIIKHLFKESQV